MTEQAKLIAYLIDEHGDYLKRTAYVMTGDLQIAEDLVQETFISFYRSSHQFRGQASSKTYLYRILVNHIRMHFRKKKGSVVEVYDDNQVGIAFEDRIVLGMDLQRGLAQLKTKYREVLILQYFNEMKIDEIAAVLNLSQSAVKMRIKRGKSQLLEILKEGEGHEEMERITG